MREGAVRDGGGREKEGTKEAKDHQEMIELKIESKDSDLLAAMYFYRVDWTFRCVII